MKRTGMRPIHPGEILGEEFLRPLSISPEAFARSMNESEAEVSDFVKQQRGVSAAFARKLSIHLNTTPEFWLDLQSTYDQRRVEIGRG